MDRKIIHLLIFLMCVFVANSAINASLPKIISRKVLLSNPSKTAPKLSPDGKRIAYLAPQDGVLNVWVYVIKGFGQQPSLF